MTSTELASQKIDVSGVSYELDGKEAPKDLSADYANGPFDALDQIKLIQKHTDGIITGMGFPEGTVYTGVPMPDSKELAACKAGTSEKSEDECGELKKNDAARTLFDNSNFKQASLYTSVLAFGVSALVVGLGVALLLISAIGFVGFSTKATADTAASGATA
jgi:uncharacterized membrane protein